MSIRLSSIVTDNGLSLLPGSVRIRVCLLNHQSVLAFKAIYQRIVVGYVSNAHTPANGASTAPIIFTDSNQLTDAINTTALILLP
jgi:hypothetical protein